MSPRYLLLLLSCLTATVSHADPGAVTLVAPAAVAPSPLPWFDEVRDQRRALQALRRGQRGAEQDARFDEFLRRRHERRELVEEDRWLFMNYGPWLEPLAPPAGPLSSAPPAAADNPGGPAHPPPGWNNRWYFNGW